MSVVTGVAATRQNHHAGVIVVARIGAVSDRAVAVADDLRAEFNGFVDRLSDVVPRVAVGFDQHDLAVRTRRRDHVEIERNLHRPIGVGRRVGMLLAVLIELLEASVERGADRQPELVAIDVEIRLGIGVVEGIHDRNGLPAAVASRRQVIRGLASRWARNRTATPTGRPFAATTRSTRGWDRGGAGRRAARSAAGFATFAAAGTPGDVAPPPGEQAEKNAAATRAGTARATPLNMPVYRTTSASRTAAARKRGGCVCRRKPRKACCTAVDFIGDPTRRLRRRRTQSARIRKPSSRARARSALTR